MNHWIIAPILIPAFVAPIIVLALRHHVELARVFSIASALALLAVAIGLVVQAAAGPPQVYLVGSWPAPFGIVLVLDRLSAAMLMLTALLSLAVLAYASAGWDKRGKHFHALFQFQLLGLNGAFLTGDLFNLFVFFEVLLIASYALLLHGSGPKRLTAGVQYVVINLAASTLLLVAIGTIYGVTGTLNLAHIAVRASEIGPGEAGLYRAGGLLLLTAFAVKAALAPVHFWLPRTYAAASPPVAALFAIMTKVGVYSILRVSTLMFGEHAGEAAWAPSPWLGGAALVTLVLGMAGVAAARDLRGLAAFSVVASTGTVLAAISVFTPAAASAAMYYLAHSTVAAAGLFLIAGLVSERRGAVSDGLQTSAPFAQAGLLGALFFAAAIALVGLPPLAGFAGKLLILDAVFSAPLGPAIWAVILGTTVLGLIAFARAGSTLFWSSAGAEGAGVAEAAPARWPSTVGAAAGLLLATALLSAAAGPVTAYLDGAAAQLFEPARYVGVVLGGGQ